MIKRTIMFSILLVAMVFLPTLAQGAVVPTVEAFFYATTDTSVTPAANFISTGGDPTPSVRGICWSTSPNPTNADTVSEQGPGTGIWGFNIEFSTLIPGTTYYVRAYGINTAGIGYSNELTFTTPAPPVVVPTVEAYFYATTDTSVTPAANFISTGGDPTPSVRGICWSTSPNPTNADTVSEQGPGTGIWGFNIEFSTLMPDTTYYVRAYGINTAGIGYSNELTFTTPALPVVVPTVEAYFYATTDTSVTPAANFISTGGDPTPSVRGICWSTSPNPTNADTVFEQGPGTGIWGAQIEFSTLIPDTTYYVRAYGINTAGIGYSNELTFTTPALPNQAPVANAGASQTVRPGTPVTLDGSLSSDPDANYPMTYAWAILQKPSGSAAALATPDQVSTSINIDTIGEYRIQLVVTDGLGLASEPAVVTISTVNSAPVAAAGDDKEVINLNVAVALNGSQSWDDDGDALTYLWTLVNKPVGSTATLSNPTVVNPTITPDMYGEYELQLEVSDFWTISAADVVVISTKNLAPIAEAGNNQSCAAGATVSFNGSASSDPNGDAITYSWQIVSTPDGSNAYLTSAGSVTASLHTDLAGEYVLGLMVNDGLLDSPAATAAVVATSYVDSAIQKLNQIIIALNAIPNANYKNKSHKKNLTRKVSSILGLVEKGKYSDAYDQLDNMVKGKMDGCALNGSPEKNDWIITCSSQNQVYPLVNEALVLLDNLF